jgi:hypothetical protein
MKPVIISIILIFIGVFAIFNISSEFEKPLLRTYSLLPSSQRIVSAAEKKPLRDVKDSESTMNVSTVENFMSEYNTRSNEELRDKIKQIMKEASEKNLFNKSNKGNISDEEKINLLQIVRLNTALYQLLIERELESSKM